MFKIPELKWWWQIDIFAVPRSNWIRFSAIPTASVANFYFFVFTCILPPFIRVCRRYFALILSLCRAWFFSHRVNVYLHFNPPKLFIFRMPNWSGEMHSRQMKKKKKKLRCTKGSQDLSVWLDARRKYENVYCYFDDFSRRLKVIVRMCFPRDIYNAHPVLLYRILCTAFERVWQNEERKQWLFHSVHSIFNGNISLLYSLIVCRRCLHRWCASLARPSSLLSSITHRNEISSHSHNRAGGILLSRFLPVTLRHPHDITTQLSAPLVFEHNTTTKHFWLWIFFPFFMAARVPI